MKTHHRNPASTSTTNPARLKTKARLLAKTMPAFAAGLLAILTVAPISRVDADPPSVSVTDQGTQVDGNLNITGDLLKNGVPWNPATTLSPATASILGGIKVGSGLSITSDGLLSVTGGGGNPLINASIVEAGNSSAAETLSVQNPSILYVVPKTVTTDGSVWFAGKLIVGERSQQAMVLLTPVMTSNTSPAPFKITYSSAFNDPQVGWAAFHAFEQNDVSAWFSASVFTGVGATGVAWIQIYLGATPQNLRHVILRTRGGANVAQAEMNQTPRDFILQGSTDGTNFFDIKSVTDSPQPPAGPGYLIFHESDVSASINYFRLYITKIWGGSLNVASIGEIELYGY